MKPVPQSQNITSAEKVTVSVLYWYERLPCESTQFYLDLGLFKKLQVLFLHFNNVLMAPKNPHVEIAVLEPLSATFFPLHQSID